MKKVLTKMAVAATFVMVLAGCTQGEGFSFDSVGQQGVTSEPSYTVESPSSVIVTLGGSSSCPPVITDVTTESGHVIVSLKEYKDVACTADFALTAFRVTSNVSSFNFNNIEGLTVCSMDNCSDLDKVGKKTA